MTATTTNASPTALSPPVKPAFIPDFDDDAPSVAEEAEDTSYDPNCAMASGAIERENRGAIDMDKAAAMDGSLVP